MKAPEPDCEVVSEQDPREAEPSEPSAKRVKIEEHKPCLRTRTSISRAPRSVILASLTKKTASGKKTVAVCKVYDKMLSYNSGTTSNLHEHLKTRVKKEEEERQS